MQALTRISVPATPDYALRVPSHLQVLVGAGVSGGLVGLGLLLAAPTTPVLFGYFLLAVGLVCSAFALAVGIITSSSRRERARRQMLDTIAWRGDERVLDVGCGNGFLLIEAAKHLTSGSATGIDLWKTNAGEQSPEVARRNAHLEGVADRVEIKNADARAMPFADSTFDVIVSSLMLHHAGGSVDRNQVLHEMVRVLKPGGTVLLYDVSPLIGGAAQQLRARGLGSLARSGGIMGLLSARRLTSAGAS
jgi:SAM-dependent methyltransferase